MPATVVTHHRWSIKESAIRCSARMTELPGPEAEDRFDDPFNVLARETVGMLIRYSHSPALAHSFDDCTR
jgi:hypothetical protein